MAQKNEVDSNHFDGLDRTPLTGILEYERWTSVGNPLISC